MGTSVTTERFEKSEEIALLLQVGRGDREAFATFYDRYAGIIFSTALRVLNDATDAEDVTQEVFVMIWDKAAMYDPARGKPLTWAVTMTRNKAIDRIRSHQRRSRLREEAGNEQLPEDTVNNRAPSDDVDAFEQGDMVRAAVGKLSTEQRIVIEMAYFKGLTQNEIAEQLHEPLGTVKARIRRGMMKLKKLVGPPEE
jgi:RNA polymerase sigma-70 factor (ECF subfamily)